MNVRCADKLKHGLPVIVEGNRLVEAADLVLGSAFLDLRQQHVVEGGEENFTLGIQAGQSIEDGIDETHRHGTACLVRLNLNVRIQTTTVEELDELLKSRQGLPDELGREPCACIDRCKVGLLQAVVGATAIRGAIQ